MPVRAATTTLCATRLSCPFSMRMPSRPRETRFPVITFRLPGPSVIPAPFRTTRLSVTRKRLPPSMRMASSALRRNRLPLITLRLEFTKVVMPLWALWRNELSRPGRGANRPGPSRSPRGRASRRRAVSHQASDLGKDPDAGELVPGRGNAQHAVVSCLPDGGAEQHPGRELAHGAVHHGDAIMAVVEQPEITWLLPFVAVGGRARRRRPGGHSGRA